MACNGKGAVTLVREFFEDNGGRKVTNSEMLEVRTSGIKELADMIRAQYHR